jgi:hypothetical protein
MIENIKDFIVENEREFWQLRKKREEERIKFFISKGIKVVMNGKDAVRIIGLKENDKNYTMEILNLAEEYIYTLQQLDELSSKQEETC